jgi:hypothetical protein
VALHHLLQRREVWWSAAGGGDDLADLAEVGAGQRRPQPGGANPGRVYDLRIVAVELASWKPSAVAVAMLGALIATQAAAGAGRAVQAPRCVPAKLSAMFGGQGATQSLLGGVTVTNHGRETCRLTGRPTIAMRDGSPQEGLNERAMNTTAFVPRRALPRHAAPRRWTLRLGSLSMV